MKIIIQTPDFRPSASLKEFITSKVSKLEKLHQGILSAEVTVEKDNSKAKELIKCSIIISIPGKDEFVKASSTIFEDAILKCVENAKRRLRIRKTQLLLARKKGLKEKSK